VENYFQPQSLDEAVGFLSEHDDDLLVLAGGTMVMPLINEGISAPEKVMGLRQTGLDYIRQKNKRILIGATATLTQLMGFEKVPVLQTAAKNTGAWTIRNMGTIGGNLFVPPPAGDVAVALLALDARVTLARQGGKRTIPILDFYTGFMSNVLRSDELLAEIEVPIPTGKTTYIKYGRKHANTPAIVTVAAHLMFEDEIVKDARIALNAVGPHPIRANKAESVLTGSGLDEATIEAAAYAASEESDPFTDAVASEWYRWKMVKVYVGRALNQINGQGGLQ
jgi:CO/xanthine dehydrogenase FAD-binding subunit